MKPAWIFVFALAACATNVEQHIAATKSSWDGAAYDEVVRRWGAPSRSTTLQDGRETHTWVSERFQPASAVIPTVGIFGGSHGGGIGAGVGFGSGATPQRCERTLTFKERAVVEQNWSGPPEYCNTFGRS
jgi:hypothetical protein